MIFFISYHVICIFKKKKKKFFFFIPYHNFRENLNKNIILI